MSSWRKHKQIYIEKYTWNKNCFIEEINQNDLTSEKYKNVCTDLNHIEDLLILASVVTGCVFYFFSWYCKFCSRVKNSCNNCRNLKVEVKN